MNEALFLQEGRCTKTVMRSFSPQFSHSLEFALPLVTRQTAPPYTLSLADRLAESSAVVEVWHKVPRTHSRPAPVPPGAVTGRPLAPVFRDVCLGQAVVPLITLLETHTGDRLTTRTACGIQSYSKGEGYVITEELSLYCECSIYNGARTDFVYVLQEYLDARLSLGLAD